MINDVAHLMDESRTDLAENHEIQSETADTEASTQQSMQYRQEREEALRGLEPQTSTFIQLANSTVEILKMFTAETKELFMAREIVDCLAAMSDYNLDALANPRCRNMIIKNPEKYRFDPKHLLGNILQVFLNLSG